MRQHAATATWLIASALSAALLSGCGSSSSSSGSASSSSQSSSSVSSSSSSASSVASGLLSTDGTQWVDANNNPVLLKGTNLGNWLLQEFWMMGQSTDAVNDQCTLESVLEERFGFEEREWLMTLFRDNWITERDWDHMADFGLNVVRLPFIWNLIEDENNPYTLREDAWKYLDQAIAEAAERDMYVILDLHGAVGSQGWEHHSGCAEQNWYWDGGNGQEASYYQDRTIWLWEQIAERYQDNETVAAYGLLNEPWGTTPETLAQVITTLYNKVRAVDSKHVIILPGHSAGIDAYGNPADHGMENVAFEMHFYPGIFGWGEIGYEVQRDWLTCGESGAGGVCEWNQRLSELDTPFLIGEFQPWTGQGLELGGKIARATYDTYGSYGWAATNWAYKVLSNTGGQGAGTWGMVTNEPSLGLLAKADTWACVGWDSTLANACGTPSQEFTVPGDGPQEYFLAIKAGACCEGNLNVALDSLDIIAVDSETSLLANGSFGDSASWNEWTVGNPVSINYNQTDAAAQPSGAEGAYLHLTSAGESNGGLYQKITLEGGTSYRLNGVFKDNSSSNAWAELYLASSEPQNGIDITGESLPQLDFHTASLEQIEALFELFGSVNYDLHQPLQQWLTADEAPTLFDLPEQPTGLNLNVTDAGNQLSWNANASPVDGYYVYRSQSAGNSGTIVATVTEAIYLDSEVDDATYYYRIAAFNGDAISYPSNALATAIVPHAIPSTVQAEAFMAMQGIQTETTSDTGGGENIGYLDAGDWIEYQLNATQPGNYTVTFRVASSGGSDGFSVVINDDTVATVAIPNTGDWQAWQSVETTFELSAGDTTMRIEAIGGAWNMNWIEFSQP